MDIPSDSGDLPSESDFIAFLTCPSSYSFASYIYVMLLSLSYTFSIR